jgi:hypothetical protein
MAQPILLHFGFTLVVASAVPRRITGAQAPNTRFF